MITVSNQSIPLEKLGQFHEILCATGGRYLSNPVIGVTHARVSYTPGDYQAMNRAWRRCNTPIVEKNKNQWWRIAGRRVTELATKIVRQINGFCKN